ncbi:RNA polymerase sigma factor [Singulisphaera sp. PoT]|uniref:RNA polymerase sigma factor n=1 Tax=Singulisphaera sp. PoT TaxID=3411797 RepID=UPI003BF5407B
MSKGHRNAILPQIRRAFDAGSVSGVSDRELLERFAVRGDEIAFEVIVARHGPMVLRVCRSLLRDEASVEDAFQASFLVLVRKARSIRLVDTLGPWLYAVSSKVAHRARAKGQQQRERERPGVVVDLAAKARDADLLELPSIVQSELARLPDHFRAPIVLFYLEGLTHDQTAAQLRWPVGTVRSRLARARGLLRERLIRKGFTLSVAVVAALLKDQEATAALPRKLSLLTVEAAIRTALKHGVSAGIVSASVSSLTERVLFTMMLNKLKFAVAVVMTVGAFAGSVAVQGGDGSQAWQDPPTAKAEDRQSLVDEYRQRAESQVETKLNKTISVNFVKRPLEEILSQLAKANDLNVTIDIKSIKNLDINKLTEVSFAVTDAKIGVALKLLLQPLNLDFKVEADGVIVVSKPDEESTFAKPYYVGDLLGVLADARDAVGTRRRVNFDPLVEIITSTIEPDTWVYVDPISGQTSPSQAQTDRQGSITPFFLSTSLIIRHTAKTHEKLAKFLKNLRHVQAHQTGLVKSHPMGTQCPGIDRIEQRKEQSPKAPDAVVQTPPDSSTSIPEPSNPQFQRIETLVNVMERQLKEMNQELMRLKNERQAK